MANGVAGAVEVPVTSAADVHWITSVAGDQIGDQFGVWCEYLSKLIAHDHIRFSPGMKVVGPESRIQKGMEH